MLADDKKNGSSIAEILTWDECLDESERYNVLKNGDYWVIAATFPWEVVQERIRVMGGQFWGTEVLEDPDTSYMPGQQN